VPAMLSRADKITSSPIRILILCVAVLMISVSGGILIGKLFGPGDKEGPAEQRTETAKGSTGHPVAERPASSHAEVSRDGRTMSGPGDNRSGETGNTPHPPEMTLPDTPGYIADLPHPAFEEKLPVEEQDHHNNTDGDKLTLDRPSPVTSPMPEGTPAWKRYAALAPELDGRPMIAIVIDDVGLNMQRVEELNNLPALLTLSFLPYAPGLQKKVDISRQRGNEVMLHLPMEPTNGDVNPGPDALLTSLDDTELLRRTQLNLDRFTGYVGVNNHMGSRFTADERAMAIVMDEMAKRGLLFLDSKTTAASKGYRLAVERGMPSVKRDYFIDHVIDETAILAQLAKVEASAMQRGVVIAIGHPHPETIRVLQKWVPDATRKGFLFVPVSVVTGLTFNG